MKGRDYSTFLYGISQYQLNLQIYPAGKWRHCQIHQRLRHDCDERCFFIRKWQTMVKAHVDVREGQIHNRIQGSQTKVHLFSKIFRTLTWSFWIWTQLDYRKLWASIFCHWTIWKFIDPCSSVFLCFFVNESVPYLRVLELVDDIYKSVK